MGIARPFGNLSLKDTMVKAALLTVALTIAIMFGGARQAFAASPYISTYGNKAYWTNHRATIYDSWGRWCTFDINFGEVYGTAYAKIRKVAESQTCSVSVRVHTSDGYAAGNIASTTSGWTWVQSCANNGACSPNATFSYASFWVNWPGAEYTYLYDGPIIARVDRGTNAGYLSPYLQWGCFGECSV